MNDPDTVIFICEAEAERFTILLWEVQFRLGTWDVRTLTTRLRLFWIVHLDCHVCGGLCFVGKFYFPGLPISRIAEIPENGAILLWTGLVPKPNILCTITQSFLHVKPCFVRLIYFYAPLICVPSKSRHRGQIAQSLSLYTPFFNVRKSNFSGAAPTPTHVNKYQIFFFLSTCHPQPTQ